MQNKKATIYDIAKACKVSTATVSRVLNNTGYPVSQKTRSLIQETAKSLNYTPNAFGKYLKSQRCKDIGVIVPNISNPYYSALLQGVYDDAIVKGYNIILCNSYRDHDYEKRNIEMLMQKQVCGIILISISKDPSAIRGAIDFGCRVVAVEQDIDVDCIKVKFDFFKGAYMAVKCLIDNNHRKIGFVGAPLDRSSRIQMLEGYKKCLEDHGIPVDGSYIRLSTVEKDKGQTYEIRNGRAIAEEFIEMGNMPTGYICINDMTALGVIDQFSKKGVRVPDDVSVIGFDNISYADISTPGLTTVDQRAYDMGAISVKLLIESIESPAICHYSVKLEPTFVERHSVKKLEGKTE